MLSGRFLLPAPMRCAPQWFTGLPLKEACTSAGIALGPYYPSTCTSAVSTWRKTVALNNAMVASGKANMKRRKWS